MFSLLRARTLRRYLQAALAAALIAGVGTAVVLSQTKPASAAVVRNFALGYDKDVFGDFIEAGNGNMRCPDPSDPVDPATNPPSVPIASCAPTQARTQSANNDNFYMRFADVDNDSATFNSSSAAIEIPTGASVDFARLNWSGDTGVYKDGNGNQLSTAACGSRQITLGQPSPVPAGTPANTNAVVTVGNTTTSVPSVQTTTDPLAGLPNNSPQYYTNYADITALFAGAPTGTSIPLTVGNVWTPQGFGCYAGWSMVVVYKYASANTAYAPLKRTVQIFDGHVRQANGQQATPVTVAGLRTATSDVRVGLTAYEGDWGIANDRFQINGTNVPEPLSTNNDSNNFFVSNADNATNPKVANNFSVDAKVFTTNLIASGSRSATLQFVTEGDSYLAQNLAISVPLPTIRISKIPNATVVRRGSPISFSITVSNPTQSALHNVQVSDPEYPTCAYQLAELAGGETNTSTCTVTAANDDFTNSASVTADDDFGGTVSDGPTSSGSVTVINPGIDITKTADRALYQAGQTITYTITVANTGDAALSGVRVTDPGLAACERTIGPLPVNGNQTYTCTTTAPVAGASNTASVTGTDTSGGTVTDTSTAPSPTAASVSGRVIADRNNDGIANESDTGIGGVTINLTGTSTAGDAVNLTTTTNPDGSYSFTNVPPGTYTTAQVQPAGYTDGQDTAGTNATVTGNDTVQVSLTDGGTSTGTVFAEVPTGSLAGVVYIDRNNDGAQQNGEGGIAGVTLTLTGTDDGNNPVSITVTSNGNGGYTFPALRPGTYAVSESQPNGYVDGKEAVGNAGGTLNPPDSISGVALAFGQQATGYLFGELPQGVIAGSVSADGVGLPGVTVTLTGTDDLGNTVSRATETRPDGTYVFAGLRPGTYTVTETQPNGYGAGSASPGAGGGTADGPNRIAGITLGIGAQLDDNAFLDTTGSLSGTVYEDNDDNGVLVSGEAGIAGVTITVSGTDVNNNLVTEQAETDADGKYTVTGLLGGTYTVTETQPASYRNGKNSVGSLGGTQSPPNAISAVTFTGGEAATGYNFGEIKPASIQGRVTADGRGIAGVTLTLTGTDNRGDAVSVTTQTNSDGSYVFNNLRPGTYTVTETQPAAYGQGTATPGEAGGTATSPDVITGATPGVGQSATGYDFTETSGSIAGRVYEDVNDNGAPDGGEPGIAAVTITVTGGNGLTLTTTTRADGTWTVGALPAGTYTVTETQPAGYSTRTNTAGTGGGTVAGDTISTVTVGAGQDVTGYLFGEVRAASITGRVNDDRGRPLAGVTITLTGTDSAGNPVNLTTTTLADGSYSFTALTPGTYTVTETQPDGYGAGSATLGTPGGGTVAGANSITGIRLTSATAAAGYDFLDTTSSLSGSVYVDVDGNGTRNGAEPGISGVTVTVTGTDVAGNPVTIAVPTGSDGAWSVLGLRGGTYTVTETQPAGYLDGAEQIGTAGGTHADPDTISAITLAGGAAGTGYLFGESVPSGLSGTVVDDLGRPIGGVTVTLTGTDTQGNDVSLSTISDTNGAFTFTNLPPSGPDGYTLTESQPAGYGAGNASTGNLGGTAAGANQITGIPVGSGSTGTGYQFTDTTSSLAGSVYSDTNRNGTRDGTEPGIGGVTVTVSGTDTAGNAVSRSTITDADGSWSVTGLRGGTYSVTETQPAGYADGQDSPGSAGGATSGTDTIDQIALTGGESADGYNFGELGASLSGSVYVDADNDGARDPGEAPIPGVTATVTGRTSAGVSITRTTTSGADGGYTVTDLPAGSYAVTESQPPAYADGKDTPGSAGGDPRSPDTITDVTLAGGQQATGYLFGDRLGVISGVVFLDADRDGTLDTTETTRLGGVTVQLKDGAGTVISTTTTAADGSFSFADLAPGSYTVVELQPTGYGSSTPNSITVTLTQASGNDVRFGETLGRIGDRVFADTNRNGVQDPGEKGVGGVAVTLYTADGTKVTSTSTDADGSYHFDVRAGSYTVGIDLPAGRTLTRLGVGSDGSKDSDFAQASGRTGTVVVSVTGDAITRNDDVDAGLVPIVHDLDITITPDKTTVNPGDKIDYTVVVTNNGTVPEMGAVVTVTLPPGVSLDGSQGEGWECTTTGQVATCTYPGTIPPGGTAPPLHVVGTAGDEPGDTSAVAIVTTASGQSRHTDTAAVTVEQEAAAPVRPPGGGLAFTGVQAAGLGTLALLLMIAGAVLLLAGRRRRRG